MIAAAMPAAGAADAPGWSMRLTSETYFVGDLVNATISGPTVFRGFVQINWTDANGTITDRLYLQLDANGTARAALRLSLNTPTGTYHVVATVNGNIVALRDFEVVFDETNFLGKRISILEKQLQDQNRQISVQRDAVRELRQQYSWVIVFAWLAGAVFIFIAFAIYFPIGPMASLLLKWKYPLDARLKKHERWLRAIANPPGSSEITHLFPNRRTYRPVYFTDPIFLFWRRQQGYSDPPMRLEQPLHPPTKVKKIRRERANPKAGESE